jgi:hypothetical protein
MALKIRDRASGDGSPDPIEEPVDSVSADLPYELQSKMFDQLATLGVAGAGLTITLIGSVLSGAPFFIWFAAVGFAAAAITALSGQANLIDSLFRRKPSQKRSRLTAGIAIGLIGWGIGMLGAAIAIESRGDHKHDNPVGSAVEKK